MTNSSSAITFPVLHSPRFLLRKVIQSDIGNIFKGLSHPLVIAYYGISYDSLLATQEQIDWYRRIEQEHSGIWWAICPIESPETLIGACGFYEWDIENQNADLGYWLHPDFWRQAVMQECLLSVLQYGFEEMHLHRIEAEVEPDNLASSKLLKKCGFQLEGRRREVARKNNRFVDMEYYAILNSN